MMGNSAQRFPLKSPVENALCELYSTQFGTLIVAHMKMINMSVKHVDTPGG